MQTFFTFFFGAMFGAGLLALILPFQHHHKWTKWEQRVVTMRNFQTCFGRVTDMGTSVAVEEHHRCETCGKYEEHIVND